MRGSEDNSVESILCFHVHHWVLGMALGLSGSEHLPAEPLHWLQINLCHGSLCLTIYLELFDEQGDGQEAWVLPSRSLQRKAHPAQGHPVS